MAVCVPFATPGLLFGKCTQEVTRRWPPPLSRRHSGAARPVSREMGLPRPPRDHRGRARLHANLLNAFTPQQRLPPQCRSPQRLHPEGRWGVPDGGSRGADGTRNPSPPERDPSAAAIMMEREAVPQRHHPGGSGQGRPAGPPDKTNLSAAPGQLRVHDGGRAPPADSQLPPSLPFPSLPTASATHLCEAVSTDQEPGEATSE